MAEIIRFTAPVSIQASATPKGPKRFVSLAYTGAAMSIGGYDLPVVVDLAGLSPRRGVQANLDHDVTKRVGNVTDVQNDGRQLTLAGIVSAASAAASEFLDSAANGYQWQASVEVSPQGLETVKAGDTVEVNGREFNGPLYVTRRGVLHGVAFVAAGADDQTSVSIAARNRNMTGPLAGFHEWTASAMMDPSNMTAEQLAGVYANYHGRSDVTDADRTAVLPMIHAASDPVEAEGKRLRQVEAACRGEWADHSAEVAELRASAVAGDLTVDALIESLRPIRARISEERIPMATAIHSSRRDADAKVIEASLCLAGGLPNVESHYAEPTLDVASRMARDASLHSLLMEAAARGGYAPRPGEAVTQGNLRRVLEAAFFAPIKAQGWSTMGLPGILSNVSNKFLLDGWQETSGDEWVKISDVKSVKNFKENKFYRLLESAEYEEVAPGGELKHGTFGEQSMSVTAATYGRMFSVTRVDIVNDDLSALSDVPRRLGRAAGMKFRRIFWKAFLASSDNFFHSSNGNTVTGAGTALALTGLNTALDAFRTMRTSAADGQKLIGGRPKTLLVPPKLEMSARALLSSGTIVAGGSSDFETAPGGNPFHQLCDLVVADWLADSDMGGNYSDIIWYLLRSPSVAPAMLVAFLNGNQAPTVETADADFNVLGIQMRGYHDFGVGRGEPLCGVQVAGTPAD